MLAALTRRSRTHALASNVALWTRRDFHLQSRDIPDFFAKAGVKLPGDVQVGSDRDASAKNGVAVLISADRDPQEHWPSNTGNESTASKFYGPSIVTAPTSALRGLNSSREARFFGQGGLGLLHLRKKEPANVRQVGLLSGSTEIPSVEAQHLAHNLGDRGSMILQQLWKVFDEHEGLWFSFVIEHDAEQDQIRLAAPYLEFDDFAVRRQPLLKPYFDSRPRNANSARAEDGGLFYVKLADVSAPTLLQGNADRSGIEPDGNVGCFGYGAGNAMATMDGLNTAGGRPANFLDGGGGANRANAKLAVETLNRDPAVKAIFINTFGGITRTE